MAYPNLDQAKIIALDIETCDPDLKKLGAGPRRDGKILGTSIAVKGASWYFIDKKSYEELGRSNQIVEGPNIISCDKSFYKWLKSYEDRIFLGANFLYDLDYLQYEGFNPCKVLDVQIAEPLIDENQVKYSLDFIGKKYLGHGKKKDEIQEYCDTHGLKGDPRKHLYKMPSDLVGKYAKIDTEVTLQVFEKQLAILKDQELIDVFDMEMRLFPMLRRMKKTGVRISRKKLYEVDDKYTEKISASQKELDKLAGFSVNVNSGKDLKKAFDKFGYEYSFNELTENMKEKGKDPNPCFNSKFLGSCKHGLGKHALTVRNYSSIKSKFVDGLDKFIVEGRLHCDFNPMKSDEYGTVSGRFSSSKPNLQQMPSHVPEFKNDIRSLFLPEDGYLWGRGDESQIELRMLAHYGIGPGSEELRQRLINNPNTDIHQECADMVGIERKPAKTINFGVVYGMGIAKLCFSLGLSLEEGKDVLNNYHLKLPFLRNTTRKVSEIAARRGFIRTILKRRRRFPDKNWCYKAANSLFQGTAAEVMKKMMVDAWESGIFETLIPHLTVHDELDYSKPPTKEGDEAVRELKYIAENCIKFKVPLVFDIEEGKNWGNLKAVNYT
jgi:DNA polymerase I-like protein with 3'-5' exonuclease and polymerase domains